MTYPNAYAGVKKIFNARILALIGIILILAGAAYFMVANKMITSEGVDLAPIQNMMENPTEAAGDMGIVALPVFVGAVLVIIWFIMELVGLAKAGKDEGAFKTAFWMLIISIIVSAVISIYGSAQAMNRGEEQASPIVSLISTVVTSVLFLIAELLMVKGIQNLAAKLNRADVMAGGKPIVVMLVIAFILGLISSVIPDVVNVGEGFAAVLTYVGYASALVSIIAFFMLLAYLGKAKKMLAAA